MEISQKKDAFFLDSFIGADIVSSFQNSFQELHVDAEKVFWTESRPFEKGRHALMQKMGDSVALELYSNRSVQTKIHEFGGGAFYAENGLLVFFDVRTSSLYIQNEDASCICLAQNPLKRWADFSISPDLKTLVCVCEDYSKEEVLNYLVSFDLNTRLERILHDSFDFYASPKWSPDGSSVAFLSWNFPFMPWEESCLKGISWRDSKELFSIGGPKESISSYIWRGNLEIIFASDRNGFSNLYVWNFERESILFKKEADCANPLWVLGRKSFASFFKEGKEYLVVQLCEKAVDHLAIFDFESRSLRELDLPYTVIKTLDVGSKGIYFIGGSPKESLSLIFLDIYTFKTQVIASSFESPLSVRSFLSDPKEIEARSSIDNQKIFGFYYLPKKINSSMQRLPPLIIKAHSGPTSHAQPLLNWEIQFWTSRGFAWLDVNYRGSSGFGKKYREALHGNWGVLDPQDCLDLAEELAIQGLVDGDSFFAKGSSAGGFTALCMAASSKKIKGCISSYGVTDLTLLLEDTHKFEKYYLDSLIGNYGEFSSRYISRSPNFRALQITCPVLLLHGDQDLVVPLNQAQELHEKLPLSTLLVLTGEGHGFRKSETVQTCLKAECDFYRKILNRGELL